MARRDDRAYREYVREEQRRQLGCPARELCDSSRFQGTTVATSSHIAAELRRLRRLGRRVAGSNGSVVGRYASRKRKSEPRAGRRVTSRREYATVRQMRCLWIRGSIAASAWVCAAACANPSADPRYFGATRPPDGQVLRYITGPEPESLDPQLGSGQPETRIYMALFDGLTEYDPENRRGDARSRRALGCRSRQRRIHVPSASSAMVRWQRRSRPTMSSIPCGAD